MVFSTHSWSFLAGPSMASRFSMGPSVARGSGCTVPCFPRRRPPNRPSGDRGSHLAAQEGHRLEVLVHQVLEHHPVHPGILVLTQPAHYLVHGAGDPPVTPRGEEILGAPAPPQALLDRATGTSVAATSDTKIPGATANA